MPGDWRDETHLDADELFSVRWNNPEATGALQISVSEYVRGGIPNPSPEDPHDVAVAFGVKQDWGDLIHSCTGKAYLGIFGTAAFRDKDNAFRQLWIASNGRDFVHVIFFGNKPAVPEELHHAQRIVTGISLEE